MLAPPASKTIDHAPVRAAARALLLAVGIALLGSGCGDGEVAGTTPTGPSADVSERLVGGAGIFIGSPDGFSTPAGYVDAEYVAAGIATDYAPTAPLTDDGQWSLAPSTSAPYRTRIIVRRPVDPNRASGTVIAEWHNVSGGVDANPDYFTLQEEIVRRGHIWIGVSAQLIGVEGGPVLVTVPGGNGLPGLGLKRIDPERYGSLAHPGDGYSFDIYTQVARAVRTDRRLLGGAPVEVLLAAGESQSAIALTTYFNGIQPQTNIFDGFFVHSRGASSLPLVAPGEYADIAGSLGRSLRPILREDLDVPVLQIQAEGDVTGVLSSASVRQDDRNSFRLWEVAGTAHADAHLVGDLADVVDCGTPVNDGPFHLVAKAALNSLDTWVREGAPPAIAPRLALEDGGPPTIRRDRDGIAIGGIRTPPVEVPAEVLSGAPGPKADVICLLLGSTTPLPDGRLGELYDDREDYLAQYRAATERSIAANFLLPEDRDAMNAYARPGRLTP